MGRADEMKTASFVRRPLSRFVAKLLIFLMVIQGFPLWELGQSYEWNPDKFSQSLDRFIDLISPRAVHAAVSTAFGPKKYIRTTKAPNIYRDSFTASEGRCYLIITNGEEDGSYRVSSAIITLNGEEIIGVNDFNQKVYRLRIAVDLSSLNNLIVELRSKPETYLQIEITATSENQSPIADAGPNQTLLVHDTVTLDGSGSTDADGDRLSYHWAFVSKPSGSQANLSGPSAVNPTFYIDCAGTYEVQLIVNDGSVDSLPDTVTITTQNSPPVANAGPDQTVFVTESVTLDGSGSTDVDGDLLTYTWSLVSIPAESTATLSDPSAVKPAFVADKPGTYVAELIVNDGTADSESDTVVITTQNSPPVANAGPDQSVQVKDTVTLDGSSSSDVDGDVLSFLWSFTTRPIGSFAVLSDYMAVKPTFIVDKFGLYVAQLIVKDGKVDSAADTVSITTLNSKPVANAGPNQTVIMGATVSLDGSASSDADGDPLSYTWSVTVIPSGSSITALTDPTSTQPSFTPDVAGLYVIQLIVNDGKVDSDPDTATVTVDSRPNRAPVAANDGYVTNEDTPLIVGAGMGVLANDVDPDGNALMAALVANVAHGILSLNANGSFTYTPDLNYHGVDSFTYTATDGLLVSNIATVTISVNHVNHTPVANAGPDQSNVSVGGTVTLDGSGSSDIDGDTLTYSWSFVSSPVGSASAFSDANALSPAFTVDRPGTYVVELIVHDGTVNSAPDTVNIVAVTGNQSPLAKDLFVNIAGDTPATIILRGSDPDKDTLTFTFTNPTYGSLSGTAPILTYTPQAGYLGPDNFTYQVDDGKGGKATANVSINMCVSSNGLAAYYPFHNNAKDESGNANNGTVSGAAATVDKFGKVYSAYSFDGVNDYIYIPSSSISSIYSFTLSAWVKNLDTSFTDNSRNHLITLNYGTYLALEPNYQYRFVIGQTEYSVFSASAFPDTNYHHVAGVYDYDNSVIKLYVDGKLEGTATAKGTRAIWTWPHYIGDAFSGTGVASWKGEIDEVRLYSRAISEFEIQQLAAGCCATATSNKSPRITSMPLTVGATGFEYSYRVIASDPDGDPLTYSLPAAPAGMTINSTGLIRWAPDVASDFHVSVQAADPFGGMDTQNYWIRTRDANSTTVNHAPIAHAGDDFTVDEGAADELDGSHSYDADGDRLWYMWSQVAGPAVVLDDIYGEKPKLSAPEVDKNTLLTFELIVNDGTENSPAARVNVMVLNKDTWPDGSGMVVNCNIDGAGSLKAAVDYANIHPGTRITFSIPDTEPCYGKNTPGVWTLKIPPRQLDYVWGIRLEGEGTFFDGNSQAENQGDRNPYGPEIELDESGITKVPFQVVASNVVVRGIVFNRNAGMTGADASVYVSGGENVVFSGNYVGTDATGMQQIFTGDIGGGDVNSGGGGIIVQHDAAKSLSIVRNLRIGGSRPGEGNLFSLHPFQSIRTMYPYYTWPPHDIFGPITIQGNTFGLDRTGTQIFDWRFGDVTPDLWSNAITIDAGKDILIGGVTAGSRNVMAGQNSQIVIYGNNELGSITIQGNYLGTDVTGRTNLNPNNSYAFIIYSGGDPSPDGPEILIGGGIPGAGNLFAEGNISAGIKTYDPWSNNPPIRIQGNLFGTDVTGTRDLNPTAINTSGILVTGGRILIGGTEPGEGNVFGGLSGRAVEVGGDKWIWRQGHQSLIEVKGNRIGLGADGVTKIPNRNGIAASTDYPLIIGGSEAGAGNTIANSIEHGVVLSWMARVLGNSIYDNGGRGIYRGYLNDPGDANYVSPAYAQNYPVIDIVEVIDGITYVNGMLDTPNPKQCLIEIFANRIANASGFGEGEQWVASLYPNSDGTFQIAIPQNLSGKYLAATATRMAGILNSSEFSPAVLAGASPSDNQPPVISSSPITTVTSETQYSYPVTASDPEGGALRYALAMAPTGMTIDDATGLITWTPTLQQEGAQVVTVVAYDAEGLYGSQNFTIQVVPLVDSLPPLVSPSFPFGLVISTPYSLRGTICDPHLAYYGIEVALVGTDNYVLMAEGNACVTNGTLGTIDPTRLANGLYTLRITAYDQENHLTVYTAPSSFEVKGKLKIGQFSLAFQDVSIPVSGIPINVIRSYNSFNKKQGDFGIGWDLALGTGIKVQVTKPLGTEWTAEYDYYFDPGGTGQGSWVYKLTTDKTPKVLVTYADGRQDRFEFRPDFMTQPALAIDWVNPIYRPLEGTTSTLEDLSGTYLYLQSGQLLDLLGEEVGVYNPIEFKLTTADGMVLIISKIEGLKSITDRNGNTITFSPTGIAHSTGLSINMERDGQGRVTRITDPMGRFVSYVYSGSGDLTGFTDQGGNTTTYGYDADHNLTSITDARGIQILQTQYDAEGRMIGTVDGLGNSTQVTHDPENAREYATDRRGYTTIYEYGSDGNIIAQTDPLGNTTRFTYDANGNQLTKTDPLGNTWTWTYDANNNKLSETDPLGNTKRWTYNSRNQILTDTDALGHVTSYEYDAKGNLLKKTDPMGSVATYGYDWRGNRTSTTDCFGTTTYEYNSAGHKTKETDALGNVTTYTYDGNGNDLTMTRTRTTDSGPVTMVTTKEYSIAGLLIRQTDPDGSVTVTEYNSLKKKSASVDKRGNRTTYEYDAVGNLTRTTYPDGIAEVNTYDGNGNRVTYTNRSGRITTFEYDAVTYGEAEQNGQNRLIRTIFPDGSSTRIENNAASRITATIDENGNQTSFTYDGSGRKTTVRDALGNITTYTYDANGNQVSMTNANGNTTINFYDPLNRQIGSSFADGTSTSTTYAGCGASRKTSEADQAGNTTSFGYDALGRLIRVIDALGGQTTFTYDEVSNKLTQTDPNGHTTSWAYDNIGRATRRILPLGMSEIFTYTASGNVMTKTDFNGNKITYSYDAMNRLVLKHYADASQVTYTYTPTGQKVSISDFRGVTSHTYDLRDRLISATNPDSSTIYYGYDVKGNKTSLTIPSGTTAYTYDALNRLASVTDPDNNMTTYTYDNVGNRATVNYTNNIRTEYTYNSLNRLTSLVNRTTGGEIISSYAYTLSPIGNRTGVVENTGRTVNYIYDVLSRLTREQITDSVLGNQTITYTYDAFGNQLTKTDSLGTTTYSYNANDQLLTETAPSYTAIYTYDNNGNTTQKTQGGATNSYTYDFENRFIGSQTGSQQVTYEYDVNGIRTKTTTSADTTNYLVDKNRDYAQVLEERDSTKTLVVSYLYGDDLISQNRSGTRSYYHYDGQMSTRKLSNASGTITDSYLYGAFGNLINRMGTTTNNYLYTGEQYDPNVGFYYLRARYYNPLSGRFTTHDPLLGNPYDPISLHRYLYANANPILLSDPSGEMTLIEVATIDFLLSISVGAATYSYTKSLGAAIAMAAGFSIGTIALMSPYIPALAGGSLMGWSVVSAEGVLAWKFIERNATLCMNGNGKEMLRNVMDMARTFEGRVFLGRVNNMLGGMTTGPLASEIRAQGWGAFMAVQDMMATTAKFAAQNPRPPILP